MGATTEAPPRPQTQKEREQEPGFDDGLGPAGEGGESLEEQDNQEGPEEVLVDLGEKITSKISGGRPTESELSINAISRPVKGQVDDDDEDAIYAFVVFGRVESTQIVRHRDGSGKVTRRIRRSKIKPQSYAVVDPDGARELISGEEAPA